MAASAAAKKAAIPKALREQVWLAYGGERFVKKCSVWWCTNKVTPFQFHVGHNIAEAHGGPTALHNLRVVCASCNLSMGTQSIDDWSRIVAPPRASWLWRHMCCCCPTTAPPGSGV